MRIAYNEQGQECHSKAVLIYLGAPFIEEKILTLDNTIASPTAPDP